MARPHQIATVRCMTNQEGEKMMVGQVRRESLLICFSPIRFAVRCSSGGGSRRQTPSHHASRHMLPLLWWLLSHQKRLLLQLLLPFRYQPVHGTVFRPSAFILLHLPHSHAFICLPMPQLKNCCFHSTSPFPHCHHQRALGFDLHS